MQLSLCSHNFIIYTYFHDGCMDQDSIFIIHHQSQDFVTNSNEFLALLHNTLHRGIIHCIFLSAKQQSHTDNVPVRGITEVLQMFCLNPYLSVV